MKVETVEKTEFQPIELKITIETPQELCDLWHRFNLCESTVYRETNDFLRYSPSDGKLLFGFLDKLVEKNNLRYK